MFYISSQYFWRKFMKGILQYPVELTPMTYGQFCEETNHTENPFINRQTPGFKIMHLNTEHQNISWEPEENILPFFQIYGESYK